jgi:hypothetical protein
LALHLNGLDRSNAAQCCQFLSSRGLSAAKLRRYHRSHLDLLVQAEKLGMQRRQFISRERPRGTTFAGIAINHVPGFILSQLVGAGLSAIVCVQLFGEDRQYRIALNFDSCV